ncbi:hypothetical protein JNW87_22630, partial [Micromonospora sp. ATA51]|nr:hypothetical protein [Micromonospora sp. ATA51]
PAAGVDADLQRVVRVGERAVAVGRRGDGLGAWLGEGDGWRPGGGFGDAGSDRPGRVWGLTAVAGGALAVVAGGATGWFSADGVGWSPVVLPVAVPGGSDRTVAVAGAGGAVLLLEDNDSGARIWSARGPWSPG